LPLEIKAKALFHIRLPFDEITLKNKFETKHNKKEDSNPNKGVLNEREMSRFKGQESSEMSVCARPLDSV
jgi:hypothetical protein